MTKLLSCPNTSNLERLAQGRIPEPEMAELVEHVLNCSPCAQRLDVFQAADPFVKELKAAGQGLPAVPDADALIEQLAGLAPASAVPTVTSPTTEAPTKAGEREPPARLGRYHLVGRLGAGGMGVVYQAHDPQLKRDVAIKVPTLQDADAQQRFLREARAAAAVRHAHVCPIYDVGEDQGRPYVVMAFVEGESLSERLRGNGRFEPRNAVALLLRVADALVAVHAAHIVHRDLKPGNILLDRAGQPYLTDFGLAHMADSEHLTATGQLMGTPAYMAPEQAATDLGPVGPQTDQFSLGIVLYQLLTGRLPFEGSARALIHQIGSTPVPPPSQHRPDLDPTLERVLLKALAREPKQRYGSVADFAHALRTWQDRAPAPVEHRAPQRRRLTMLQCGCDLFESELILAALDVEEQHDLLREFQQLGRDAATRFDGIVVQVTDHGLLIGFGYPVALEDAAERAVLAGLNLMERMNGLNDGLRREKGVSLSARLAAHCDFALVQETAGGATSFVGQVLLVVDKLERLAAMNTLVISEEIHQMVKSLFRCTSLGPHSFKASAGIGAVYRVEERAARENGGKAPRSNNLTPLVGRDRERALLHERWNLAVEGMGQVVLLNGEPGIGKSRLVHDLKEYALDERPGARQARCIEWPCTAHSQVGVFHGLPYFQSLLEVDHDDSSSRKLDKLAAHLAELGLASTETISLIASLLHFPLEGRYPPLGLTPQRQKEKTFEVLLDWLRALAQRQPVLFVMEDLHWAGPITLEFLTLLVGQTHGDCILTVLTSRPEFQPPWKTRTHHCQISLNRLTRRQTGELLIAKAGRSMVSQADLNLIADRTDGVPLFVEEFAAMLLEAGSRDEASGRPQLADAFDGHVIPATLHDLLLARLERAVESIEVVQLAATIGREFNRELLQAAAPWDAAVLDRELTRLVEADLLLARGRPPRIDYQFKHALIRDAAYQSLLKKKRQQFHLRIAEALEQRLPETVAAQPEVLAHHFTEGNAIQRGVTYWERAGIQAQRSGAPGEAASRFTLGLELIRTLPETPQRLAQEIALYVGLGAALQATRGYGAPEVEAACERAHALCQKTGLTTHLFPVLQGLCRWHFLRARYARARELAEEMLSLPEQELTPGFVVAARYALGATLYHLGKYSEARLHLEYALAVEPAAESRAASYSYDVLDPWVTAKVILSRVLWMLGYADRAAELCRQALTTAEGLDHPFSLCYTLSCAAWIHQVRRDQESARETAERARALATENGFPVLRGWSSIVCGLSHAEGSQSEPALAEVRAGMADLHDQDSEVGRSSFLSLRAEACARAGRLEEALQALAEAQNFVDATKEGFWQPEIYRLKGELVIQHDTLAVAEAEACFQQALSVAQQQQARSLELRAAISLAQLWLRQGKTRPAGDLVEHVYAGFNEGFETYDLQNARTLLQQCRSSAD